MFRNVHGVRRVTTRKDTKTKEDSRSLWDFLNSPFGVALLSGMFLAGLGGLYTYARQAELAEQTRISSARKLLSESHFRLNEVRFRANEVEHASSIGEKQGFSRYIYGAAMGVNDFIPGLHEYKGVHWAGVLIELDSLVHVDGFNEAMQSTQDLEQGFYNNGLNYFDTQFLEGRIKLLSDYQDRVEAKTNANEAARFWMRKLLLAS
jgi:hypothetical protein